MILTVTYSANYFGSNQGNTQVFYERASMRNTVGTTIVIVFLVSRRQTATVQCHRCRKVWQHSLSFCYNGKKNSDFVFLYTSKNLRQHKAQGAAAVPLQNTAVGTCFACREVTLY